MTNEELANLIDNSTDACGSISRDDVLKLLNEHRPESGWPKPDPKAGLYAEIKRTAMSGRTIRAVAESQAAEPIEETYNEINFDDSLEEIQRKAWVNSAHHKFHGTATDSELMALIASEAFEAFEVTREAGPMTEDKRARIAEELADIVIRCGDVATILEIDLGQAVQLKHAYNLTRPILHGKAK